MNILIDDGTWEPTPSGYNLGNKESWRDRIHALCPNPVVGQVIETNSINGGCVYYKALDANGYDTRWLRVTSKFQKGIEQIEEWVSCCINEEKEYLYRCTPNPAVGEIIIATMDRQWCNRNENERVVFQYTKNGWKELGDGHYPNSIASSPSTTECNYNSEDEMTKEVNDVFFDDEITSSIINVKYQDKDSIHDESLRWYADLLDKVYYEFEFDDEIRELVVAEGKNIPHPHRPEWASVYADIVGFGDWGEGYNNCRVVSYDDSSQYGDNEDLDYGSKEYFEYRVSLEKKRIERELRELGIREKISKEYKTWKIWCNKNDLHFEICSIEPSFNYNSDIQNAMHRILKSMISDGNIIIEDIVF